MKNLRFVLLVMVAFGLFPLMSSATYEPCIDLVKTGPTYASPGETITFHFKVTNCGNTYLGGNATVYDPLLNADGDHLIWSEGMFAGTVKDFDWQYTVPVDYDQCTLINDAWAIGIPWIPEPDPIIGTNLDPVKDDDTLTNWAVSIRLSKCASGTGTPGYWKNHPEAWPVDEITIGGIPYQMEDAIGFMKMPGKGDKTFTMFNALVSAKLNVEIGNPSSCIAGTIAEADKWMAAHPIDSHVSANSAFWKAGEPLYMMLDKYNNGLLCAPHRD